jgi:hypothetical protein
MGYLFGWLVCVVRQAGNVVIKSKDEEKHLLVSKRKKSTNKNIPEGYNDISLLFGPPVLCLFVGAVMGMDRVVVHVEKGSEGR